jgi:hypothetical protein
MEKVLNFEYDKQANKYKYKNDEKNVSIRVVSVIDHLNATPNQVLKFIILEQNKKLNELEKIIQNYKVQQHITETHSDNGYFCSICETRFYGDCNITYNCDECNDIHCEICTEKVSIYNDHRVYGKECILHTL